MPVLPLVASITVWPGFSSPDCSAASITPSASRSLTEPNGLKASTFTNRFTPGGPSLLILTTVVLPTVSRMLSYRATLFLPTRHSRSFDQRRRSFATQGLPSEPAAPVLGDCSSVRGPESRSTCARNSCQEATLRNLRDQDQFLAVGRGRAAEIAIFRLDREATEPEQMVKLPAISPAQRHLARVLRKHRAVGGKFGVAPEIMANLVEVVETCSVHLAGIAAPSLWMSVREPRPWDVGVDQQIEARIEQMQDQAAGTLQMAMHGLQRSSLPIDRQQVLEGASGHEGEAKAPA